MNRNLFIYFKTYTINTMDYKTKLNQITEAFKNFSVIYDGLSMESVLSKIGNNRLNFLQDKMTIDFNSERKGKIFKKYKPKLVISNSKTF